MPAQSLPLIDRHSCTLCGDCLECCPVDCLEIARETEVVVVVHACVSCGICAAVCPVDAIAMSSQDW